jgi:hypothetical protein
MATSAHILACRTAERPPEFIPIPDAGFPDANT